MANAGVFYTAMRPPFFTSRGRLVRYRMCMLRQISLLCLVVLTVDCSSGRSPDVAAAGPRDPVLAACGNFHPCLLAVRRSLEREKIGTSPIVSQIMTLLQAGRLPQSELLHGWSDVVTRESVGVQLADGRAVTLMPAGTQLPARSVHVLFPPSGGSQYFTINYVAGDSLGASDVRSLGSYRIVLSGKRVEPSLSAPPVAVETEVGVDGQLELIASAIVPEVGPNFTVDVPQVGALTFPTYATVGRKSVAEADLASADSRILVGPPTP
jgi:hypothetical protein